MRPSRNLARSSIWGISNAIRACKGLDMGYIDHHSDVRDAPCGVHRPLSDVHDAPCGVHRPPFRRVGCSMWGTETTIPTCGEPYRPLRYPARPAIWVMRTYFRPAQRSPMTNQSPLITLIICKTDYLLSLSNGIFTYLLIDCRNLSTFIA